MMNLAILETGLPPEGLQEQHGSYPEMMVRLIGDGFAADVFDVQAGELPEAGEHDGVIVMGSPAGVYEPLPWIPPLLDFIRASSEAKMVGVCFGHQAMAQALGGQVEKSAKGWGTGLHQYEVVHAEPWLDPGARDLAIPASHQDQVVVQPPNTQVVARSDFTPYAALAWTDRPAISFQFHPEFTPAYAKALIDARRDRMPNADARIATLDAPNDTARVGGWIRRFLTA